MVGASSGAVDDHALVAFIGRAPAATDAPTVAVRPPDLLDLYGVLAEAGSDLIYAAEAVYRADRQSEAPTAAAVAGARSAAARVLRTLAEFDGAPCAGGIAGLATYMRVGFHGERPIS
jgi:hypothetical protein